MALGAVQSEYAGETCVYRRRDSRTEEFYNHISSRAQMMKGEPENNGKVIGLATFPCGNGNMCYDMQARYAAESTPEETADSDLTQQIRERMEELIALIKSGETEASFQIGNSSFTIKEWERFLERFDDIEDAIRELMRERIEKETDRAAEESVRKKDSSGTAEAADGYRCHIIL